MRRGMSYRQRPRRGRSASGFDYLMPFLIVLCIGVIGVLLFKLWQVIFAPEPVKAAYLYVYEGKVSMKFWGNDDFFESKSGALVNPGDAIQTQDGSKAVLEFFDGTIVRIDGGSDLVVEEIDTDENIVKLLLVDGNLWINKSLGMAPDSEFSLKTTGLVVNSDAGAVFQVENEFEPAVRVIQGRDVSIDVLSEDGKKAVETETLGVGQEVVFTAEAFDRYWQFQSPSLVAALSDNFKLTDFYVWNTAEDKAPTDFKSEVGMMTRKEVVALSAGQSDITASVTSADETEGEAEEDLTPAGPSNNENVPAVEENSGSVSPQSVAVPVLTSVNGLKPNIDGLYQVDQKIAKIEGTVGAGVSQVFVNDYALQKFVSGNTTWTYFANADYDLMKPGLNTYNVYAVDAGGKKSAVLTVKINYVPPKPQATPTVAPATDAVNPSTSSASPAVTSSVFILEESADSIFNVP